jgi:hypothetical protein
MKDEIVRSWAGFLNFSEEYRRGYCTVSDFYRVIVVEILRVRPQLAEY